MSKIDDTDRRLLRILQMDADVSLEQLAHQVSLSTNSVWRRIKRLESDGVILRRVAVVDPRAVGLTLTVFVAIKTRNHSLEWLQRFCDAATKQEEIVEIFRMAGETDYLLKIYARSVEDYDRIYKRLIANVTIEDVSASFAIEVLKNQTVLPL